MCLLVTEHHCLMFHFMFNVFSSNYYQCLYSSQSWKGYEEEKSFKTHYLSKICLEWLYSDMKAVTWHWSSWYGKLSESRKYQHVFIYGYKEKYYWSFSVHSQRLQYIWQQASKQLQTPICFPLLANSLLHSMRNNISDYRYFWSASGENHKASYSTLKVN